MCSRTLLSCIMLCVVALAGCGIHFSEGDILTQVRPTVPPEARSMSSVVLYLPAEIRDMTVAETTNCRGGTTRSSGTTSWLDVGTVDVLYQNGHFTLKCFVDPDEVPTFYAETVGREARGFKRVSQYRALGVDERDGPVFEDELNPDWVEMGSSNFRGRVAFLIGRDSYDITNQCVLVTEDWECGGTRATLTSIDDYGDRFSEGYVDAIVGGLSAVFGGVELAEGVDAPFPLIDSSHDYQVSVEIPDEYRDKALIVGGLNAGGWLRDYRMVFHSAVIVNIHDAHGDLLHSYEAYGRGSYSNSGLMNAARISLLLSAEEAMTGMSNEVSQGASRWIGTVVGR